jgi:Fungal Zn(2)-Cys(6) binuclear cluster domain
MNSPVPSGSPQPGSLPRNRRRSNSGSGSNPAIRRRNRQITSCLECRRRKLKCDKTQPCSNCTRFSRECVFLSSTLDPAAQMKLAEIKEKMGSLERTLEDDVARRGTSGELGLSQTSSESSENEEKMHEDERHLEPTPLAILDASYAEDVDDDLVDLGIMVGKMRITERIGGFIRPKLAIEVSMALVRMVLTWPAPTRH